MTVAVHLKIEGEFICDVVSVGTVAPTKIIRAHLGCGLRAAHDYVELALSESGALVPVNDLVAAKQLVADLRALPKKPRVYATVRCRD